MRPATPLLIALLLALLCTAVRAQDNSTITPTAGAGNGTLTEAPVQPCVASANLVIAPVGANCSNASLPAGSGIVCERGSLCRNCNGANCSSDLVCIARPRINEPCTNPTDLPCFHPTFGGIECVSGTCRFANIFGAGEACFDSETAFANGGCLNGLACTNGTCGTRLALNASCDTTADACGPGLFCSAANGSTCVARLSEGAACEGDHQCAATLICSDRGLKNGTFCFQRFQLPTGSPCTKLGDCVADNFCTLGVCRSVALAQNCTGAEATPQCNADTTCTCTASGDRKCIGSFFTADQISADQAFRACLVQNQCLLPELAGGIILGFGPRACWATNCCAQAAAFFNVTATDNCVFATPPPTATTEAPAPTTAAPAPTTAAPAPTTAAPTPAPTTAAPAPTTAAPTPSTQAPTPAPTTQAPAPQASATSAAVLTTGVTATSSGGASTSSVATTSGGATSAAATTGGGSGGATTGEDDNTNGGGNPGSFTGGVQFPANAASAALPSALLAIGLGAAALLVAV